jgi:predicted RNase H-like HicB family nuclease
MKYVYPAIFRKEPEGGYFIFFPDIQRGGTCGEDVVDGMEMATDFLCLALWDMEEDKEEIPTPSNMNSLKLQADDFATLVYANTNDYRYRCENKKATA